MISTYTSTGTISWKVVKLDGKFIRKFNRIAGGKENIGEGDHDHLADGIQFVQISHTALF